MTSDTALLYHYTSADGFLGILRERELWATEYSFMNDPSELVFAAERVANRLRVELDQLDAQARLVVAEVVEEVIEALEQQIRDPYSPAGFTSNPPFPVSFSNRDDHLTLWRLYAGRGGFCLGFDEDELVERLEPYDKGTPRRVRDDSDFEIEQREEKIEDSRLNAQLLYEYTKVEYGEEQGEELISEMVSYVLTDHLRTFNLHQRFADGALTRKLHSLASVKHRAFSDERETRLVLRARPPAGRPPRIRVSPTAGVVPYHAMRFPNYALRTVTVAPGQNQQRAVHAATVALSGAPWKHVAIERCEIPFAW